MQNIKGKREKVKEKKTSFSHYKLQPPDEILTRAKYRNYGSGRYSIKQVTV